MPRTTEQGTEATHGKRMLEVRVRFWTDDLAAGKGRILPKHAWASGVVMMAGNDAHGVVPGNPRPFNDLFQLQSMIENVLIDHGVKLHPSGKMKKLLEM